jgi:Calcineurin-like phosphoesterase
MSGAGPGHDLRSAASVVDLFEKAAAAMRSARGRDGSVVRLPARGRLLATGDLHDHAEHFRRIVRLADLDGSPEHHVVLHEIIHGEALVNGLDLSHRMLARVAQLVLDHPGQAHVLLGNHELGQMAGHRVSKGAGDNVQLFNEGLAYVFGDDWEAVAAAVRAFIAAMPLAVRSDSGLLCAHSLPAPRSMGVFDPGVLERPLAEADYRPRQGSAYLMVWGRGWGEAETAVLSARWGVDLFCVGHEHVAGGIEPRGARAIILNSDHAMGAVVPFDLAAVGDAAGAVGRAIRLAAVPGDAP